MIINKDVKPNETIFYLSAILNKILKNNPLNTTNLYSELCKDVQFTVDYQVFILSINFLFLIKKIMINEKGDILCI